VSPLVWIASGAPGPADTAECPLCAGRGWTECPWACHGFGVCGECGDTGKVDCRPCKTTGRVSPAVRRMLLGERAEGEMA
jgi:hypothetical protein